MKSRPDRGFIKELARKPEKPTEKPKSFTYSKPVTPESKKTESLNTPRRLANFRAVKPDSSGLVGEQTAHIKKRRGEV